MSLINQIEDNVITDLYLDDKSEDLIDDVRQVMNAIGKNTSIEKVTFDGYLGCVRGDQRRELVELIGCLPKLDEVHISQTLLVATALTKMITKARSLRILKLTKVVFQGVDEEISSCELALMAHNSLKEFEMSECSAAAAKEIAIEKLEKAGKKISTVTSETGSPKHTQVSATVA